MSLSEADYELVEKVLFGMAGNVLGTDRRFVVEAKLTALAESRAHASVGGLVAELRQEPSVELERSIAEALLNHETHFFRDVMPFRTLTNVVLPELLRRHSATRRLGIWSAGCSTGQEAYSLAFLLNDFFMTQTHWPVQLLASDLSMSRLARAKSGRYSQLEINRGLPAVSLVKYFTQDGASWVVRDYVRSRIDFRCINLMRNWPPMPQLDVVFLRNVLIYFDLPTKREILRRIRQNMAPGGYLFLGNAETTYNVDDAFERLPYDNACCFQLRDG